MWEGRGGNFVEPALADSVIGARRLSDVDSDSK
jgi:hypothetical protein